MKAVVTSTSLELGVDIGEADLSVLVGLPGSASRCLQRVGRAGHSPGATTRGLLLAGDARRAGRGGRHGERVARTGGSSRYGWSRAPLDVLCQQLIGMACAGEWSADGAFELVRKAGPMAGLSRRDFDACLDFLAGDLAAPSGAFEPEPGATPKWTAPRIWKLRGRFGVRSRRVVRWFWGNVGTITSEESCRVVADGTPVGTLEAAYAERLQAGDKFVLDGRSLEFRRLEGTVVHARASGGEPNLPRWSSDRQGLSPELAREVAAFRSEAARRLDDGPSALRAWLAEAHDLDTDASGVIEALISAQEQASEVPSADVLLVEESPTRTSGFAYTFHAPLGRPGIEALARATSARLGRRFGRDLTLAVADLGWSIGLPEGARIGRDDIPGLVSPEGFADDVLEGLDRGDLPARRFRHVAATALMVLRNPDGGRTRVGGMLWVSQRLYPLVVAACPEHPLLRETRREVLEDLLDVRSALAWLGSEPTIRLRGLAAPSPFAMAWVDPSGGEPLRFESADHALGRLHARLVEPVAGRAAMSGRSGLVAGPDGWWLAPEGAVVHVGERTAIIADVHLGYEWSRGSGGDVVPAHSLAETVAALGRLLDRAPVARLVVAGDLVESPRPCRRTEADFARLRAWLDARGVALIPVLGNHDPQRPPRPPLSLEVAGWTVAHGHRPVKAPSGRSPGTTTRSSASAGLSRPACSSGRRRSSFRPSRATRRG